jgi:hypothetical protein
VIVRVLGVGSVGGRVIVRVLDVGRLHLHRPMVYVKSLGT